MLKLELKEIIEMFVDQFEIDEDGIGARCLLNGPRQCKMDLTRKGSIQLLEVIAFEHIILGDKYQNCSYMA